MKIRTIISLGLIGLVFACSPSTKLEKSWADPSFNSANMKPFTKVLVVAPFKDATSQRVAEDKIVLAIKNAVAVPAYSYLKPTDLDEKAIEEKLIKDGFDGVIMMRLKDVTQSTSYTPGTSYGGWYGYRYYSPGYYSVDKTFQVETNFYSLTEKKLMWSGVTSSLNPSSLEKTLDQIIYTIKYELEKKGYFKK